MKKYRKTLPIYSPKKVLYPAIYATIGIVISGLLAGWDTVWPILCFAIGSIFGFAFMIQVFQLQWKYGFFNEVLQTYFGKLRNRSISYDKIGAICITNAVRTVKGGSHFSPALGVMQKKDNIKEFLQYPWVTLLKTNEVCKRLTVGMSSQMFLCCAGSDHIYGFVYDLESFNELLQKVRVPIYILEDVYLRFQSQFDQAFSDNKISTEDIHIIIETR